MTVRDRIVKIKRIYDSPKEMADKGNFKVFSWGIKLDDGDYCNISGTAKDKESFIEKNEDKFYVDKEKNEKIKEGETYKIPLTISYLLFLLKSSTVALPLPFSSFALPLIFTKLVTFQYFSSSSVLSSSISLECFMQNQTGAFLQKQLLVRQKNCIKKPKNPNFLIEMQTLTTQHLVNLNNIEKVI